jgi:hypothetical protein
VVNEALTDVFIGLKMCAYPGEGGKQVRHLCVIAPQVIVQPTGLTENPIATAVLTQSDFFLVPLPGIAGEG